MCQDDTPTLISKCWNFRQMQKPLNPTSSDTYGQTDTRRLEVAHSKFNDTICGLQLDSGNEIFFKT